MRLASRDRAPRPTLVTTGTGSGKTEAFLVPLLDHCRRQRRVGQRGIKALVLYPMNALANDQARRIAKLVHQHTELGGVTVGLYTGDSDGGVEMTETSVIGDKYAMRRSPPDILLTNYKMLDMYVYAQTLTLEVNPANGAMEVLRARAIQEKVSEFRQRPAPEDAVQVLPFHVAELVDLGINPGVAEEAVRLTDEDDILDLAGDLPEWQQRVLLELATGTPLEEIRATYELGRPSLGDDPVEAVERPTSRMQFVYIDNDDELRRMMEGDFAAWRTYLHPKQPAVAYRETFNGPYRLTGGAGTGKTVVALHRAAFLAKRPGSRVLLCTFTRNLASNLQVDIRSLVTPDELPRVDVRGVDQVVRAVVQAADGPPGQFLAEREQETMWEEAVRSSGAPGDVVPVLTAAFLAGEYRTVVLGMSEHTREAYLRVKRTGRGVRLNRVQRAAVWNVVEAFERSTQTQGKTTFELLAARAAQIVEAPALREQIPTYNHIVVDEGQDLHAGHWRVLRGVVPPGPNDLFICEDGYQRIFGERTVLSRFGIETRGRSRRLTLNYRTSRQNLAFALGVIGDQKVVDLDGEEDTVAGYHSAFTGPAVACQTWQRRTAASDSTSLDHHGPSGTGGGHHGSAFNSAGGAAQRHRPGHGSVTGGRLVG